MPPSQHLGASCLCLSGSVGAHLSPALTPLEHQTLPLSAQGIVLWGRGMSSFLYLFQKEVSQGSRNAVWPRAPSPCDCPPGRVWAAPLSSGPPGPPGLLPQVGFLLLFKAIPSGVCRALSDRRPSRSAAVSDYVCEADERRLGPPHWLSHTERSCCRETKQNRKSHKKVCIKTYFCTTWGLFLHVSNKTS